MQKQQQQHGCEKPSNQLRVVSLPLEIIEHIVKQIIHTDVVDCFRVVNGLNKFTRYSPFRKNLLLDEANGFSMDYAMERGLTSLLDWWLKESGVNRNKLPYSNKGLTAAVKNNHVHVLEWFFKNGLSMETRVLVDAANGYGRTGVLQLLKNRRIQLVYSKSPVDVAYVQNYPHLMKWWVYESGEPLTFTSCPMALFEFYIGGKIVVNK